MEIQNIKENKVKMILQFSIPSIIAMLLTSLISVTDGFFLGNYAGKEGLAAVNLGLPIVYLYLSIGLMFAIGGMAISGRELGAGRLKECNQVFRQTMVTVVGVLIALSIVMFFLFTPILNILHAEGLVAKYFNEYYKIMLLTLPVMVTNSTFGVFIRGEGNPQFFMLTNILNVILNIVLDYVFRGFGPKGIALSSFGAALVSLVINVIYFVRMSKVYHFGKVTFDKQVSREMVLNGSSEFIGEMASCISMFAYNYVIMKNIGVNGLTAFTIIGYLCYGFSMIVIGFGQGICPLISFAFGAKEYDLAKGIRKTTNKFVFIAGMVTVVILSLARDWYSSLFVQDAGIQDMVRNGILIFQTSFLICGFNQVCSFYFTSIGKAKESAVISAARGLVILLICIFTLPVLFGMNGVWLVAPVTEGITLVISGYYLFKDRETLEYCLGN